MTSHNTVIIAKGKDITFDISDYRYENGKVEITFLNRKSYVYNPHNVTVLNQYKSLDSCLYTVFHNDRELFDIVDIKEFADDKCVYWQLTFGNNKICNYNKSDLEIQKSCLDDKTSADCLHYLSRMADLNDLRDDDGEKLLAAQYQKVSTVNLDTVLAEYLNPDNNEIVPGKALSDDIFMIFPFGCNESQYSAVKNALTNKVSIIEGPPGTGKTQTILNIIANLVLNGKNVQIVSNNNAATDNVFEKLSNEKYGLDFIVARLGSVANKNTFFESQSGLYPEMSDWKYSGEYNLTEKIHLTLEELKKIYRYQSRLADVKEQLSHLSTEFYYFKNYCSELGIDVDDISIRQTVNSENITKLLDEAERQGKINIFGKFKGLIYGIGYKSLHKKGFTEILNVFRYAFYSAEIKKLNKDITKISAYLEKNKADEKSEELQKLSLVLLKDYLYKKYSEFQYRKCYDNLELLKRPRDFLSDYPVVLSTTFSSLNSINGTFDYVIIDESSQADIATGALALRSANNAVIVGDSCQLPFVISDDKKKIANSVFENYCLSTDYNFAENSFLDSVKKVFQSSPLTLLREHYRCEPKIIGFCNEKFYNGELIVMTESKNDDSSISAIKTKPGNHARGRYNQRQIEVIINEVLPNLNYEREDIGIIAPYNEQVDKLIEQINDERIKISTVHKFQGREKKVIILCTVDNIIKEFVDDPKLLNVAISRAEEKFILVTNSDCGDGNISDLISYIEYNNMKISDSKIYSVFDMLYKANTEERIRFLSKHGKISEYDSENLMYDVLSDLMKHYPDLSLACHTPLNMILRKTDILKEKEKRYAENPLTHIDFLLYKKISKMPVLAIEVDGYKYHKEGTKQSERDKLKESILFQYDIPLIRLSTTGSDEVHRIESVLNSLNIQSI